MVAAGFFSYLPSEPPEPEHPEWRPPPWMQAPDDELPAVVAMPRVIARSDQAVISLSVVEVFSTGVRIPVDAIARRRDEDRAEWQAKLHTHHYQAPTDGLRLGVQLADGTRLGTDLEGFPHPHQEEPPGPTLVNHGGGGGGGDRRWELVFKLWLWPLPPAGTLDLVTEWRALGIPESRVTLDASVLRAAAGAVQPLWAD